ncbi:MAG: M23 family metallopeptidase [Leptospiraceae bacterium]|nr:M23 family metallopeptidase [Leptospiraceae bacterium]MBK7057277.1 M23 family metallopeptidase [Leptospiraceae bacterium]MBL0266972.1 M23 family metallopeptidase [Leptospiraceae bacterium]MBP9165110.1 M23 family metallopeptidase [Leptospiraceae bacterium]
MNGRFYIFLLFAGIAFTTSQSEIVNYRKSKPKEELQSQTSMVEAKESVKSSPPLSEVRESRNELIPIPNTPPIPEKEKIVIPMTPPTGPPKPQVKQTTQFSRPFNQKLITIVNFSANPENPHKGVVYSPIEMGSVLSSMEGRVAAIDYMDGYHNYIILEHPNGFFTVYGNLDEVFVAEGQTVKKGSLLGSLVKEKGLYFQVNQGKKTLDPISLIKS